MKIIFTLLVCSIAFAARAQSTRDIMLGGGVDLLKTDNRSLLNKAQLGFEGNYFIKRRVSLGIGAELWTNNQKSSFVLGTRLYANDKVFFRFRGLIGANDLSIGMGYSKPIDKNLRLEGMGDYYLNGSAFALRVGLGYVLR
ncbi:MAG: hypothetical protein HY015_10010 [Bacteroidetes bacterium]|nr:hypothetical protein [Bacteroidota bacterium]MBI3483285.1 hypothetical protein [Bacteroidota bacterium]